MNALEIKGLVKEYRGFRLDGLDLTLPSGCILVPFGHVLPETGSVTNEE